MIEEQEFDNEFYEEQIKIMEERYSKYFNSWKLSWNKYKRYVAKALRENRYWIWIYYCGFEKFLKESSSIKINRKTRLYKDADERIARIIGDFYKVQNYVKSL